MPIYVAVILERMNLLDRCFAKLKTEGKKAFIPYVMGGDPSLDILTNVLHTLAKNGADIIEVGIPFSDPVADGVVIQGASERALARKVNVDQVFSRVRLFRKVNIVTPIVVMTYCNPIEAKGIGGFSTLARESGVDAILTVDLPPEESENYVKIFRNQGLHPIFLLSPTTSVTRIRRLATYAAGFVYYVSLCGVTGASCIDIEEVSRNLDKIRKLISLPIGVGFGVHNPASAGEVAKVADAVIVGTALVKYAQYFQGSGDLYLERLGNFCSQLSKAVHVVEALS